MSNDHDNDKLALFIFNVLFYILLHIIAFIVIFLVCKHYGPKKVFYCIFNIISLRFLLKKIIKHREGKKHLRG